MLADEAAWTPTDRFNGGKLWAGDPAMGGKTAGGGFDLKHVRQREAGDAAWSFQARKGNGVGVLLRMLPEPGTVLCHDNEGDVTTIIVERRKPATTFAALHEHYRGTPSAVSAFERLEEGPLREPEVPAQLFADALQVVAEREVVIDQPRRRHAEAVAVGKNVALNRSRRFGASPVPPTAERCRRRPTRAATARAPRRGRG